MNRRGALSAQPTTTPPLLLRTVKLLLIGDSGVGKSCLALRFADNQFTPSFVTTIGIDFKLRRLELPDGLGTVKLQLWDTAGQERFRSITTNYFRDAQGVVLVYDCSDERSFGNCTNWISEIARAAPVGVQCILVANKCDLGEGARSAPQPPSGGGGDGEATAPGARVISEERGRALARQHQLAYFETSAKTGTNVAEAFTALAVQVVRHQNEAMAARTTASESAAVKRTVPIGSTAVVGGKSANSCAC